MVKGLTRFVEHFAGFENAYILIGGAACDLWLSDRSLPFRATKDLDLVLVVEALDPAFFERFWAFIQDGRYRSHQRSESRPSFYRFKDPETAGYRSLAPADRFALPAPLHSDLGAFLDSFPPDSPDWPAIRKAVGNPALPDPATIQEQLRAMFNLSAEVNP